MLCCLQPIFLFRISNDVACRWEQNVDAIDFLSLEPVITIFVNFLIFPSKAMMLFY